MPFNVPVVTFRQTWHQLKDLRNVGLLRESEFNVEEIRMTLRPTV